MGLNESLLFCFEVLPWNDKTTRETGNFRDDFSQKTNDDGCELRRQSLRRRNKRWKNCSSQQAGIKFLATVQFKLKPKEQNSFNFMQIVCTSAMKGKINFVFGMYLLWFASTTKERERKTSGKTFVLFRGGKVVKCLQWIFNEKSGVKKGFVVRRHKCELHNFPLRHRGTRELSHANECMLLPHYFAMSMATARSPHPPLDKMSQIRVFEERVTLKNHLNATSYPHFRPTRAENRCTDVKRARHV